MLKSKKSLGQFISDIIQKYQTLQQYHYPQLQLRLIEATKDTEGKYHLSIQLIGKSAIFKSTPEEILADNNLVKQFSSTDIRAITYYACQTLNNPKNKIISKHFSDELNTMVFEVKNYEQNTTSKKTAAQISLDKQIVTQLSPEDAHMIGYIASQDTHSLEKDAIQKARAKVSSTKNRFA